MRRSVDGHDEMCPLAHRACGINWDHEESLCPHREMPFGLNGQCLCNYIKDIRWTERANIKDELEGFMSELVES